MDDVDSAAKLVWDYLQLKQKPQPCDAIFVLCSMDTRVAERAAQLFLDGFGKRLIFSGGVGKLTEGKFATSEARAFADVAVGLGVPSDVILVEDKSTNTGENIQLTYSLLQTAGSLPKSLLLVQKPYMERRSFATFKQQWPDQTAEIFVTSPQINYEDYFNADNPKVLVLNVMVGDLQRIKEYPKLGFQIEQPIPADVWEAYECLVHAGYTEHLIGSE